MIRSNLSEKSFHRFESDTVRVCAQSIALYRNPLCEIRPRPFRYRHPWIIYISVWTIYTENAITSYKFVVGHLVKLWKNILNCISEERKKILQFQILSLIVSLPLLTISIKLVIVNWKFVFQKSKIETSRQFLITGHLWKNIFHDELYELK